MANKKGNPLSGAFRSPAPGDPPPWEEKPDKAAGAAPSKPGEVKPAEPPKEATDPKAAGAVPGKPGEAKPAEPPKGATDPKAAGAAPGRPDEGKPTEPPKEATDPKATGAVPGKPGEAKPAEPPKEATDPKATGAVPGKPGEGKPIEPPKEATDPKAAGAVPGKPGEGKPTEPPKDPNLRFVKLSQIVPLPGTYVKDTPRADYKELIASIKKDGLTKPVILRKGEKGDYQLVDGFHRCKALEQDGALEVQADLYEMSLLEASRYRKEHRTNPDLPIPGKLIPLHPPTPEKPAEEKPPAEMPKTTAAPQAPSAGEQETTRTAEGPKGSTVTHIFDDRLDAPGEDDLHSLPIPKEGEVYSLALHPAYFRDFLDHPFSVNRETQDYKDLFESIKTYGIREPVKCRPGRDGGVEIISGHRRHDIGMQLNYPIPTIIEQIDEDDAQIQCVDGNLHRKDIPISELARAAQMKMEALKRKQGRRSKADILTGAEPPKRTDELVGEDLGMSRASVQRLMRVNKLEEPLKQMVDKRELPLDTAEQISHMKPEEQKKLADAIEKEGGRVPSKTEAVKLKEDSKAGKLTPEKIEKAVAPTKRETEPELKVTFNNEELRPYFPDKGTTVGDVKRGVFEALVIRKKVLERQAAMEGNKGGKPKKPPAPAR